MSDILFPTDTTSVTPATGDIIIIADVSDSNNLKETTLAELPISTATQTAINTKQDTLVSGTNIKTVNGTSLLGSGDIAISGGGSSTFLGLTDTPSSYSGQALKVVQVNAGATGLEFATASGGGNALTSNPLSQFASTTSAQLAGVMSDETGSGAIVFANSPTLVTPALGTPASGTLTNCTGLPLAGVVGSTSGSLGVGTLEVGHASDTTISRSSAGVIAVEGVVIPTVSSTNTLTNKTLTTPNIASIKGTLTADTDGATITFNKNVSDFHSVTLGGNRTLALSNMSAGDRIVLRLAQDGTGSRTVTWFANIKWAGGTAPTLTTTANKADLFGFLCTSAGNYDGFIIGQNI